MTTGNSNAADRGSKSRSLSSASYVRSVGSRCLAYRDASGHWRNFFSHEWLAPVIEEASESRRRSSGHN